MQKLFAFAQPERCTAQNLGKAKLAVDRAIATNLPDLSPEIFLLSDIPAIHHQCFTRSNRLKSRKQHNNAHAHRSLNVYRLMIGNGYL
jgi:hypothetical protein